MKTKISNSKLLSQVTGVSEDITTKLCKNGLYALRKRADQLESVFGLSKADAKKISSVIDFATRMNVAVPSTNYITDAKQAYDLLRPEIIGAKQEMFFIVMLDEARRVIDYKMMSKGSPNSCKIPTSLVLRECLMHNANAVILAHNHPSGECEPSDEDIQHTIELSALMNSIGISLLDHIILADNEFASITDNDIKKYLESEEI